MALQKTYIHRAFTRPLLLQGGEHRPMLGLVMLTIGLVFVVRSLAIALLGIIFFFIARAALQRMAKAVDPQAAELLVRHYKYKKFYKSHATPWGGNKAFKRWY